ncbi:MAG: serine hydrolase domain-containing protein, partial [Desulfobacteraceae bacterium]
MDNIQKELDNLLRKIKDETGVPGLSLALNIGTQNIVSNIGTVSVDSDIPMTENTQFQLGCISKLFTAMVTAELFEAGKLDPNDPIEKYIHELRGTQRGKEIQIWHLLSHTSGYRGLNLGDPRVAFYYTWEKFLEFFISTPQLFKPGSVFSYEHSEYAMLGEIIQRITGSDILDLYHEMIIEPLKLNTGSIRVDQRGSDVYAVDHIYDRNTKVFEPLKPIPYANFWKASLNSLTMNTQDLLTIASTICGIVDSPATMSKKALKFVQKQFIKLPQTYGSTRHEQVPITFGAGCA